MKREKLYVFFDESVLPDVIQPYSYVIHNLFRGGVTIFIRNFFGKIPQYGGEGGREKIPISISRFLKNA